MNKKQRKLKKKRQRTRKQPTIAPDDADTVQAKKLASRSPQSMPLWTKTGEMYQPVRIYYNIRKSHKVRRVFEKLRCLDFNDESHCWFWQYTDEAAQLEFEKHSANSSSPITLGSIMFNGPEHMHLDVHSIERALAAMSFFDCYLSPRTARITHLSIVNRLFPSEKAHAFSFDQYDAANTSTGDPISAVFHALDALQSGNHDEHEKTRIIASCLNGNTEAVFPEVEHLTLRFSRRNLNQLWFLLGSRQYVAIQHWKGNTGYRYADYIQDMLHGLNHQLPEHTLLSNRHWRSGMLPRLQAILMKWLPW